MSALAVLVAIVTFDAVQPTDLAGVLLWIASGGLIFGAGIFVVVLGRNRLRAFIAFLYVVRPRVRAVGGTAIVVFDNGILMRIIRLTSPDGTRCTSSSIRTAPWSSRRTWTFKDSHGHLPCTWRGWRTSPSPGRSVSAAYAIDLARGTFVSTSRRVIAGLGTVEAGAWKLSWRRCSAPRSQEKRYSRTSIPLYSSSGMLGSSSCWPVALRRKPSASLDESRATQNQTARQSTGRHPGYRAAFRLRP